MELYKANKETKTEMYLSLYLGFHAFAKISKFLETYSHQKLNCQHYH